MTVVKVVDVVRRLHYLDGRVEHDNAPGGYTWVVGGYPREAWYLSPNIFRSLVKRNLIVKVETRAGTIDVYKLARDLVEGE